MKKECPSCLGKKYNSAYKWSTWWYTDFWPSKYIQTGQEGIIHAPCRICEGAGYIEEIKEPTKQEMIDRIYKEIGDTETIIKWDTDWSFKEFVNNKFETELWKNDIVNLQMLVHETKVIVTWFVTLERKQSVMIWDVLDWIEKKDRPNKRYITYNKSKIVYDYWKHKRKPIEDQPIASITYINSLIKN